MRHEGFDHLVASLEPQLNKQCEVLVFWDNFEHSLGAKRQALLEAAKGEYICFVDDDDTVPDYYVEKIFEHMGQDYIGWRQQLTHDGEKMKPTFHSLEYSISETDTAWYAGVTHLNPIKRKIALQGRFDISSPEDIAWAAQVRPQTERVIDPEFIMYYYEHSTSKSLWTEPPKWNNAYVRRDLPERFRYVDA